MKTELQSLPEPAEFDVVVVGAGGAGMSAALFAAIDGAKVLLIESTAHVGGTTAYSGATTWVVGTRHAPKVNPDDSIANAERFLDAAVGERTDRAVRRAFLDNGAAAVAKIEDYSHVKYRPRDFHPDYLSELEGSTTCGRALEPLPFDGRLLGGDFGLVRPPIPEFTVLGGMMVDRDDIIQMLAFRRRWWGSWRTFKYVARTLLRHASDRLSSPRGTRLVMGNALIGRLLLSLRERGVTLLTEARVTRLARSAGASGPVDTLSISQHGVTRTVRAKGGVILASGGFNRHPQRRAQLAPGVAEAWCPGAPGHTGAMHDLAEALGAAYGQGGRSHCFWAPVSLRKRRDGSTAVFPHFVFDRAKPGTVVVNQQGQRYYNESTSYHLTGITMQQAQAQAPSVPSFLVTDANGMHKYGLGMVRPLGMGLREAVADGYVVSGRTLEELAGKLGVDAGNLKQAAADMGRFAQTGVDTQFQRGTTTYQRANGDATWRGPNPTLGPIDTAPFYAVRLYPGDIGAATGLWTDADARCLDAQGQAIAGLYAVGNDQHSIMGGAYPGPGITLGPGLVFAYLAARSAVARANGTAGQAADEPLGVPVRTRLPA
ncbi:MAG: 3-oxosteroid 1-dehydrogenase [Paracidovorax wautersii]|uniref:3-oxosteroid 1-dehydrogenase n=1 Tax=Paracidovorax wautersii TaxID=1177982 RepID=A0A7V8FQN5_9BURK|nr:MAG: 3-oxosteroid 1-dehydrogenase [Paracidovorax wautersii]